jgi:hypothetical protein
MRWQVALALLGWSLTAPLLNAQTRVAKLPSSPAGKGMLCSRVGKVLGRNVFSQSFLLKRDDGQVETVPFSRWTAFFKVPTISNAGKHQEIEPTEIRLGDRLCVLLDSSGATSTLILVLDQVRPLINIAAAQEMSIVADVRN